MVFLILIVILIVIYCFSNMSREEQKYLVARAYIFIIGFIVIMSIVVTFWGLAIGEEINPLFLSISVFGILGLIIYFISKIQKDDNNLITDDSKKIDAREEKSNTLFQNEVNSTSYNEEEIHIEEQEQIITDCNEKIESIPENNTKSTQKLFIQKYIHQIIYVCIAIFICGIGVYTFNLDKQVKAYKIEVNDITTNYEKLQLEYDVLLDEKLDAEDSLSEMTSKVKKLQRVVKVSQEKINELSKIENQQDTIDKLNQQIETLNNENISLKSQIDELQSQSSKKTSNSSGTLNSSGSFIGYDSDEGTMVWIPASGSKYHNKPDCGNMNPDTAQQVSISKAKSMGFSACKKCF